MRSKTKQCNATHCRRKLSKKERREDALALRAEERRDKLRKAAVRSKYPMTRRYLNGETHQSEPLVSISQSITYGREPGELKHLSSRRKRKKHRFRKQRRANAEEPKPRCVHFGVRTAECIRKDSRMIWEGQPERVKASYTKFLKSKQDPQQIGTRETLIE